VSVRIERSSPTVVRSSPDAKATRGVASMKATTTRARNDKAQGRGKAGEEPPRSPWSEIRPTDLPISHPPGRGEVMPGNGMNPKIGRQDSIKTSYGEGRSARASSTVASSTRSVRPIGVGTGVGPPDIGACTDGPVEPPRAAIRAGANRPGGPPIDLDRGDCPPGRSTEGPPPSDPALRTSDLKSS
jgi:hypothetical protein